MYLVELLKKLLNDQVKSKFRTNIVKQRKFSDLLQSALSKYQNRSIEAAQVIAELIEMAKEFKKDLERTDELNLDPDTLCPVWTVNGSMVNADQSFCWHHKPQSRLTVASSGVKPL